MKTKFEKSGNEGLKVPGFGLPINFELGPHCFQRGTDDCEVERMTARELAMLRSMEAITDKPDWSATVFNQDIVSKWYDEATAQDWLMSQEAFDWCIAELRDNAKTYERTGFVKTLESGSRCVKSDTIISEQLRNELQRAVQPLLKVDERNKDWHPGSENKVLNLIHPSLYPLNYGRTRVMSTGQVGLRSCLESCGQGQLEG